MKTSKHTPPSRKRYEQKTPGISIRMPKEWHDALITFLQETGQSRREFMAIALNKQTADYNQAYKNGYNKGYKEGKAKGIEIGKEEGKILWQEEGRQKGYAEGQKEWASYVTCYICKKPIYFRSEDELHRRIIYLTQGQYCHSFECPRD
ncbi:MAG: hypothetical protein MUO82_05100 [Candidatus Thermoplasmatota archaeon]|nr:hypothetical protein [Candidatus Thermoplasmatota archaeon]